MKAIAPRLVLFVLAPLWLASLLLANIVKAQTTNVIPANEAAAHVGEYATVEGVVAKLFSSKSGNTFLNIGAGLSQPDVYRMDSAGFASIEVTDTLRYRRKAH